MNAKYLKSYSNRYADQLISKSNGVKTQLHNWPFCSSTKNEINLKFTFYQKLYRE